MKKSASKPDTWVAHLYCRMSTYLEKSFSMWDWHIQYFAALKVMPSSRSTRRRCVQWSCAQRQCIDDFYKGGARVVISVCNVGGRVCRSCSDHAVEVSVACWNCALNIWLIREANWIVLSVLRWLAGLISQSSKSFLAATYPCSTSAPSEHTTNKQFKMKNARVQTNTAVTQRLPTDIN